MKFHEIRELTYKTIKENIFGFNLSFDNQSTAEIDSMSHHVTFSISELRKDSLEIGYGSYLIQGEAKINIYSPEGLGLAKNYELIDKIDELFFNKWIENIYVESISIENLGAVDSFYHFVVKINFEIEALKNGSQR
jgi:hypothetical protein